MMKWFREQAPIRQKMMIVGVTMVGLTAVPTIAAAVAGYWIGAAIGGASMLAALVFAHLFREAVCVPYVTTVVRMEALAAGDLDSPIQFTDYRDCVGRLTKAMFIFRDMSRNQQKGQLEEQAVVAQLFGEALRALREGDLTYEITAAAPPAYQELKSSYNEAVSSMRALLHSVTESTQLIGTGSEEIAGASEDLARRTESSAANLEETSAAIGQMDERLKATAVAANRTVERADQTISTVSGGRTVADQAVQAMSRVSDSAKGIDSVIEGLDKIAFQTRVLAMNAAVEAGRAGDAGRGFAVVADLVSALAMRAEEEAKRARDQLTVTQTDIVTAVQAVEKVDGALADISTDVTAVHELLNRIATDNQAQASAITQINSAIANMDQSTQQNAAMVEQTSAAARNLSSEVASLSEQAAQFKTDRRVAAAATKQRAARAPAKAGMPPARRSSPAAQPATYNSPVKPLPAAAVAALTRPDEDWAEF